jgi:outer membrane autotransporter protein
VAARRGGLAFWGQAFGAEGLNDGNGDSGKLDRTTGGVFAGVDAAAGSDWRIGLTAGFSHTDFKARNAHDNSDNYHLGAYGGAQYGPVGVRLGAGYTLADINTVRSVEFTGFSDRLTAGSQAGAGQVFGDVGYGLHHGHYAFEPFADLAYVDVRTDGFNEAGGLGALTGRGATDDVTVSTLGLRLGSSFQLDGAQVKARGTLGWRHAFGGQTPSDTLAFVAGGSAFSIQGAPIARNGLVVDAGLDVAIAHDAVLGLSYTGQLADRAQDHALKANMSWKF